MKRLNWKNIWGNARLVLIIFTMVFLYSFSLKRNENRELSGINIAFEKGQENLFITHENVNNLLKQNLGGSFSIQKGVVNLNSLETVLNAHEMIEKAEVFSSIDGTLSAQIKQKTPIVRILSGGTSYYLDRNGSDMPLSENFSARVPLVSGSIPQDNKEQYIKLFNRIAEDIFLNKHITGIRILPSGSMLMTTRDYNYKIVFGKPMNVTDKFKNYKAFFYHTVRNSLIENYTEVNLLFTKQVVCKK